jgi:hypothetical protein
LYQQVFQELNKSPDAFQILDSMPLATVQVTYEILRNYLKYKSTNQALFYAQQELTPEDIMILDSLYECIAHGIQSKTLVHKMHYWIKGDLFMFKMSLVYPIWVIFCNQRGIVAPERTALLNILRKAKYCKTAGKLVSVHGSNQYVVVLDLKHPSTPSSALFIRHAITGYDTSGED